MTEVVNVDDSLQLCNVQDMTDKKKIKLIGDDSDNLRLLRTQIYSRLKADGGAEFHWQSADEADQTDTLTVSLFPGIPADIFLMFDLADRHHLNQLQADGRSVLADFKKILVPGPWMARKLVEDERLGLDAGQVVAVGSPRIDYLRSLKKSSKAAPIAGRRRVLFAPLHENWSDSSGKPMSSSSMFTLLTGELEKHCELVMAEDQRNKLNKRPVTAELINADVVITDYTSLAYEAWALGKPVIFPRWLLGDAIFEKSPRSTEAEIYRRGLGYHPDSFEALLELLQPDSDLKVAPEVSAFCALYFSNYEAGTRHRVCQLLSYLSDPHSAVREAHLRESIDDHLKHKRWDVAEVQIMDLLSTYPDDPMLHEKLSFAYQGQHKWWQVVIALKDVIRSGGATAEVYHRLGLAEKKMGHYRSAAAAFEQAILLAGSVSADWYYRLGYCYETNCHEGPADTAAAIQAYKTACELDKKHKAAQFGIGVFHAAVGRWSKATESFSAQSKLIQFDFDLNFRLGRAQERCYLWAEAETSFRNAIGLRMKSAESHFRLGLTLERQAKYEAAIASYRHAIKLGGKNIAEWRYRAGMVLIELERFEEACGFFLALQEGGAPIDFERVLYESSLMSHRVNTVSTALQLDPEHGANWFEFYEAHLQQGNIERAREGLSNAATFADERQVARILELTASLNNKMSDVELLQKRLHRDCTKPETWIAYSKALVTTGQLAPAAEALQHAIWRTNEHKADLYLELGKLLALCGETERACEAFRFSRIVQRPHGAYEDKFVSDAGLRFHASYKEHVELLPIMDDSILYEVHNGSSMACNPLAIFEYLLKTEQYAEHKHFWVVNDLAGVAPKYRNLTNVYYVTRGSDLYLRLISSCKYLICNGTFAEYFVRRPGQKYLNTWHGTPLKTLGRAMNTPPYTRANTARNFLHATHLIFPNEHTRLTQIEGHSIDRVVSAAQLVSGYPRNDQLYTVDESRLDDIRLALGITNRKPVVLFAPTYRGSWNSPSLEAEFLIEQLKQIISDDYTLLFRGHHLVEKQLAEMELPVKLAPQSIDTNALLPVADVLISDYSSIIIDYMTLKRPVLHFIPDWDEYKSERGLYFERDELPWPQCETAEALKGLIEQALKDPTRYVNEEYRHFHEAFCGAEDGHATQRVVDFFFEEDAAPVALPPKKCIVIRSALGTINGVASSAIALVHNLAAQGKEVVLLLDTVELRKEEAGFDAIRRLEEVANVVFRSSRMSMNLEQQWVSDKFNAEGMFYSSSMRDVYETAMEQECYRVLGPIEAEISVDHQGYHPFWAGFMAALPANRHLIYLHNDMLEESEKRLPNLRKVFVFYDKYDAFLNVSESSMRTNQDSFRVIHPALVERFHLVRNGLDVQRILNDSEVELEDESYEAFKRDTRFKIVNVARLWPEKNQVRLVEMAKVLIDQGHDVAVYILGAGPLAAELENLIKGLELQERVMLLGVKRNPFPFVRQSQCHVLSSDYEGQGIVLLEAMTMGIPCVSTDIPGPDGVLQNGLGILTPLTPEGLAQGVIQIITGSFVARKFDALAYNEVAYEDFSLAAS